jgi:ABC-type multidrug transport system permease subunit
MRKFWSDALVIFEIETLKARSWWPFYLLSVVMFPIGTLYFAKWLVPPGAQDAVGTRLMTGSLVFALGLMTVNNLAQIMLWERFNSTLKLVITSPVHRLSYATGVIAFSSLQGMLAGAAVLCFSPLVGIDIHVSWWLIPVLLLTSVSLTGIGVFIATWSPSQEVGNVLANMVGIMVTLLSPVYFPIERLPHWLRWVVRFSPYTHAGAAVDGILSGSGGYGREVVYLALITAAGLALGVAGLRWQES